MFNGLSSLKVSKDQSVQKNFLTEPFFLEHFVLSEKLKCFPKTPSAQVECTDGQKSYSWSRFRFRKTRLKIRPPDFYLKIRAPVS